MRNVTPQESAYIVYLYKDRHMWQSDIAKKLARSRTTISRILQKNGYWRGKKK